MFLLDELLQGTNSNDRRIGAEGIVRALAVSPDSISASAPGTMRRDVMYVATWRSAIAC